MTAHDDLIQREVRALLARAPAYASLPDPKRAQLAHDLARVASALSAGASKADPPGAGPPGPARAVDFPGFVRSLVEGTFQAIVDGSIEQMNAYADLVSGIASSLDTDPPPAAVTSDHVRQLLAGSIHDPAVRPPPGWPPKR